MGITQEVLKEIEAKAIVFMHHPLSLVARGFSLIGELESQDSRRGLVAVSPSASPQIGPLSMSGARCSVSCSVT